MPGMYAKGDFDLAGFAVGIAEKSEMDRLSRVSEGDVLIALPSSGIHSNGYSLVRKLFFEKLGMQFDDELDGQKLIDILLTPTRIYVKTFKKLKRHINALAHITGGGIVENLPRVLPEDLSAVVDKEKIRILPIFQFMQAHVEEEEMYRTFNMGVGMVLVVSPENVDHVLENSDGYIIGRLQKGDGAVRLQ
jgi:phosphoribosylformylglycinamidine cyclo-ligase